MEMEKTCEFCKLYRPVVYCKADAAHLCLSCDAKVHSANALSNRHPRTLICESCRYRPAHVRCSDHQIFMCRGCDCSHHDFSSEHQKRVISSFTGSPSAKELAALWGFDLNELENSTVFVSTSNVTVDAGSRNTNVLRQFCSQSGGSSVVSTVESMTTTISAKSNLRSRSKHTKASRKGIQQVKNSLVLQQILDLKRLQLSESGYSSSMHIREPADASSYGDGITRNLHDNSDKLLQHSGVCSDLQHEGGLNEETTEKPFPLPFSQLDHLADNGTPSNGDSFWQCKSPLQNNQLWPHNMQDLGVCDELRCLDDFNMPDFDLTFQNFEEMFGVEQDPSGSVLDDNDMTCSSLANHPSIDTSDDTDVQQSTCMEKDSGITDQVHKFHQTKDSLTLIRPSYSALSYSHSRFSAESSRNEYVDRGHSQTVARHEHSCHSSDAESAHLEGGETVNIRHKGKNVRRHEKQILHTSYKKSKSDVKKRVKGLSMKPDGYESDAANVTRSS